MDVPIKLSKEEFALSMGLNRGGSVAVKGAQNMLRQEECESGTGQSSNDAALKDAQIKLRKEECALGTGQRQSVAAVKDAQT